MKRIIVFFTLTVSLLLSACAPKGEFRYNKLDLSLDAVPPYIEGSYLVEITADEFEELSGFNMEELLDNNLYWGLYCDGEDKIVYMEVSGRNRDTIAYVALHSRADWSSHSYSPRYSFYKGRTRMIEVEGIEAVLGYCKGQSIDDDMDFYNAEFTLNGTGVNVQMTTKDRAEFEAFIKQLIQNNK